MRMSEAQICPNPRGELDPLSTQGSPIGQSWGVAEGPGIAAGQEGGDSAKVTDNPPAASVGLKLYLCCLIAASHVCLLTFKLMKIQYNLIFTSSVTLATLRGLHSHRRLVGIILDSADREYCHHCGKFFWIALHSKVIISTLKSRATPLKPHPKAGSLSPFLCSPGVPFLSVLHSSCSDARGSLLPRSGLTFLISDTLLAS